VGRNIAVTGCIGFAGLGVGIEGCKLGSSFGQRIDCSFSMLSLDWAEISFCQFFYFGSWISFYLK
jgi:hypothetical protein